MKLKKLLYIKIVLLPLILILLGIISSSISNNSYVGNINCKEQGFVTQFGFGTEMSEQCLKNYGEDTCKECIKKLDNNRGLDKSFGLALLTPITIFIFLSLIDSLIKTDVTKLIKNDTFYTFSTISTIVYLLAIFIPFIITAGLLCSVISYLSSFYFLYKMRQQEKDLSNTK